MPQSPNFTVIDPTRLRPTMTGDVLAGSGASLAYPGDDRTTRPEASLTRAFAPDRATTAITGPSPAAQPFGVYVIAAPSAAALVSLASCRASSLSAWE